MKPDARFRVGVIGAGTIATGVHLPVLSSIPSVRVQWVADIDKQRIDKVASAFSATPVHIGDSEIELPEADVYVITVPYGARAPYYRLLRERAANVYVEKPFARTVVEHIALCDSFADHALGCGYQRRSWGPVLLVKRILAERLFGEVETLSFEFGQPGIIAGGGYMADIRLAAGGSLIETGIHGLDAMIFLVDAENVKVCSSNVLLDNGFEIEAEASIELYSLEYGKIRGSVFSSQLRETSNQLVIECSQAAIHLSLFGAAEITVVPKGARGGSYTIAPSFPERYATTAYQNFYLHWQEYLNGLTMKAVNRTSARTSVVTTKLVEAILDGPGRSSVWP